MNSGKSKRKKKIDWISLCIFLFLGIVILFIISPIVIVVVQSFGHSQFSIFPPKEFSLRWYSNLIHRPMERAERLTDHNFWRGARLSLMIAFVSMVITLIVATLASMAFVRHKFIGKNILRMIYMSPAVIPRVAIGLSLFVFFLKLGIYGNPLTLILTHTILILPFAFLIISATLINVDRSLEEAAMDLGASPIRTFFKVTIHQMSSGLATAAVLIFVLSFDEVETTMFVVRHDYQTLPIEMFNYMERWQDPTIAALSTFLIAMSFILSFVVVTLRGKKLF